jgi:CheY-like chemotaxis protein
MLKKKLLVVDDEEIVHRTLERMFRGTNVEIVHAYNGQEALAELPNAIGIILTDVRMPIMDGEELANQVSAQYPKLPLLVFSKPCGFQGPGL